MYEKPSRQACDRCHDLKLRCHRNDAGKCSRCTRATASCVFSPSSRGRRSTHQNRRAGSQVTKWTSDGQSNVKLAPRVPEEVISDLGNIETHNEEYSNGHHHIQPHPRIFEYTPISSAETREPTVPNLCVGVDPDVPLLESFTPSMSLSGAPLESNLFSRFSHQDDNTLSQITDPHLSLLEPFSGLHMPDVVPTANEIRPDITQAPSQESDVPQALNCHRKINPQTRVLQQFTEDILELDIDLIRHTLEDPVAFDSVQTTPGSDSTSTSNPLSNCPVDTTLVLTQRMIKLFSRGGNWTTQSSVPQKSPISTSSSFSSRFEQLITENAPTSTSRYPDLDPQQQEMNLDQTSILHALSTYMRLIEAYHLTFSQTTQKFGVALSEGSSIPLPSLQIGAFAMDDPAGHVALVIQSALQLLDRLGDLVNKLTMPFIAREDGDNGISSSPTPPTGRNVINMVMTTVRERESQLMKAAVGLESCCREARRPRERCS